MTDRKLAPTNAFMTRGAKRTTIRDVAKLAGVSTKTVSRVLNDEPHVTAGVQEKVREAAKSLKYHPNVMAQGLVRRRSNLIGLVYENPSPSYAVELQMGVLDRLKGERYRLIVLPIQSVQGRAGEIVGLLHSAALDGVVLSPPACDHLQILGELEAIHMAFARIAPTRSVDVGVSILLDDVAAAREAASHVIALGHRRIAVIKGDPGHAASDARLQGYGMAFADAGLTLSDDMIEPGMFTLDSGRAAAKRLIARKDRPTAILAQNDDMAVGALMAAREGGLDVPRDLTIVGFDDSEISRITWPRLTTVRQPVNAMSFAATDMLITQLEGGKPPSPTLHRHELMIRESSAPPRVRVKA